MLVCLSVYCIFYLAVCWYIYLYAVNQNACLCIYLILFFSESLQLYIGHCDPRRGEEGGLGREQGGFKRKTSQFSTGWLVLVM